MADLGLNIEEVHDLLERLESTKAVLQSEERLKLTPAEAGELPLIIGEMIGWHSAHASDLPGILGIPPTTINQFTRLRGAVKTRDCIHIADRLTTFLKSLDQKTLSNMRARKPRNSPTPKIDFPGHQWRSILKTADNKQKIEAVSRLLEDLVSRIERSNAPIRQKPLTILERQQLIVILETTLKLLKGDMIEKGLLLKAREMVTNAAVSAGKNEMQVGIENVAQQAAVALSHLLHAIFS